jgi:hypothetical protein
LFELDNPRGPKPGKAPLVEVTDRDQTEERLRVTLRNNGSKPIENIRYKVSYFDTSTGLQIEAAETESVIKEPVMPHASRTLEVRADTLKSPVYAAFIVVDWETVGGS